ncbi:MAG: hypothetical protein MK078_16820 [Crocinitomicaceae bacterium]|nr:hypothetical protein [Crocinitomicaceae bacterium]
MKKHKIIIGFALITGMIVLSGCNSNIDLCMTFDQDAYVTDDTIRVSAACSENAETYQWTPGEGLEMQGDGTGINEVFVVTPAPGQTFRSVTLSLSNSKGTRERTESVPVL